MTNDSDSVPVQVLIVEDEWVIALDISESLEELGYQVVATAASGEAAIARAREFRPDVVLMDIRLEGEMDGIQAAQVIWNELQIPIIYATAYSDQATVDRATENELFGYVIKPIKERDLYIAIKTAIQRHGRETRLREQQHWVATILKAIGDGVIVTDIHSQVKYLNLVAESLTGWQLQEALNCPITQVFPLLDPQTQAPVENPISEAFRTGTVAYLVNPVHLITKTGQRILVADSAAPFTDDAGTIRGAVMVFRDVSERLSLQEQSFSLLRSQLLEQQVQELQRLDQLKDDFLSLASHELRSPLVNIKMSIHLLEVSLSQRMRVTSEAEAPSQSQRVEEYLRILREQCDQELNLVNELLELQRLEAKSYPLDLSSIDVSEWVSQMVEAHQERAQAQQQTLQLLLPPALPPLISDILILTNVFRELLTNACKYTPPGATITVQIQQLDEQLQLTIINSGVEVAAEELSRMFDKFYRIHGSDRWNQGGTGLGLSLVKKQIIYLGGTIQAESDSNEVRFIVRLPFIYSQSN